MDLDVDQLQIIHYPDPRLRKKAAPIEAIDDTIRAIGMRMIELMHDAPGVGLAAPQVGLDLRLFVANPTHDAAEDRVFINPVLTDPSREQSDYEEGCLSIPEVYGDIRRPKQITITATDLDGQLFTLTSGELAARVWQHENDHLDGILFLDRMTALDKMANRRKLKELEREAKA